MSRPPRKAMEQIKRYCEKTQCLRCIYGFKDRSNNIDFVCCTLQESNPCDWELKEDKEDVLFDENGYCSYGERGER